MLISGTLWVTKIVGEVACMLGMVGLFATSLGYGGWLDLPSGYLDNLLIALFGATLVIAVRMLQGWFSERS